MAGAYVVPLTVNKDVLFSLVCHYSNARANSAMSACSKAFFTSHDIFFYFIDVDIVVEGKIVTKLSNQIKWWAKNIKLIILYKIT